MSITTTGVLLNDGARGMCSAEATAAATTSLLLTACPADDIPALELPRRLKTLFFFNANGADDE